MKFLELTGYGNNFTHIISLKSIVDITFEPAYTHIVLSNGTSVNVLETKDEINKIIYHLGGTITDKTASVYYKSSDEFWGEDMDDDNEEDLPF